MYKSLDVYKEFYFLYFKIYNEEQGMGNVNII